MFFSDRVETAPQGDRALDLEIAEAINYQDRFRGYQASWLDCETAIVLYRSVYHKNKDDIITLSPTETTQLVRRYTESVDDAMSLGDGMSPLEAEAIIYRAILRCQRAEENPRKALPRFINAAFLRAMGK